MGEGSEATHFHADRLLRTQGDRDSIRKGGLTHFVRSEIWTLDSVGELSQAGISLKNLTATELNGSCVVVSSDNASRKAWYKQVRDYCTP